MNLIKFHKQN